ncbi:MAG: CDP-alcohol phosphatidyltransferase family protein [Patescibacteria group bacterium]|nr:CDP-alcohol phosphatidyltransferase family protein [Patescibacteria group bacterium]
MLYQERLALYALILGLVLLISAKILPLRLLARVSTLPCCSPNWITSWGVVIFYISVAFYVMYVLVVGFISINLPFAILFFFISEAMDWLDGRMAKAMKKFAIPRTEISVDRGEWGDPAADKAKHLPAVAAMMLVGVFTPYIAIPAILVDVIGTFVRKPFTQEPFAKIGLFMWIKDNLRQSKASKVGKVKSFFWVVAIIVAVPYQLGWLAPGYLPDVILGIALPLGVLSVISRVKISREVDRAVDEVQAVF